MKRRRVEKAAFVLASVLLVTGCGEGKRDVTAEAPPPMHVEHEQDLNVVKVDHPEQFPLATAAPHQATVDLVTTGVVSPDVARTVPVISLSSGRVVDIRARLGDTVKKGQLLMRVQSADISGAFADYRKAVADEVLARTQFERSKELQDHGALSLRDMQVAEDAEEKARVDVETTTERLHLLGGDVHHPTGTVDIFAPVSGVIVEQNVAQAAGVKTLDNSPNLFTIADLSDVWILCDVYENDLAAVHLGESADVHLNAYPDKVLTGRIDNIGATLDPGLRTAKVRLQLHNPGFLRVGMFATATFHSMKKETHASVPATAILRLHDRDWVYVPSGDQQFLRIEVTSGGTLPNNMQEVVAGLRPGQRVVSNALVLQNTVEQ